MKILVGVSLFIFWAVVTAVLVAGLVFYQGTGQDIRKPVDAGTVPTAGEVTFNWQEISNHSSVTDCWLVINGKVYNVSSYIAAHPGGIGAIQRYCGKEATQAFDTKDKGAPHSTYAASLLADYYIGDLNQKVSSEVIQQNIQRTDSVKPPPDTEGEDGDGGYED